MDIGPCLYGYFKYSRAKTGASAYCRVAWFLFQRSCKGTFVVDLCHYGPTDEEGEELPLISFKGSPDRQH